MTRRFEVSFADARYQAKMRRKALTWQQFAKGAREWCKEPKARKDCGNLVGGTFMRDYRERDNVEVRSLLTLDADYATSAWLLDVQLDLDGAAWLAYTTWSHLTDGHQWRWRLMAPLSRDVTPEEYWDIAWAVMLTVTPGVWDRGGAEAERLMHLPSSRGDGTFASHVAEGEPLDVDAWLELAAGLSVPDRAAALVKANVDADAWLSSLEEAEPCLVMQRALNHALDALDVNDIERYPTMRDRVRHLVALAEEGHAGLPAVLDQIETAWRDLYAAGERDLDSEWTRCLSGAVQLALGSATEPDERACCLVPRDWKADPVSLSLGAVSAALTRAPMGGGVLPSTADEVANEMIRALWTNYGDCKVLRHWLGDTYEWHNTHWEQMPPAHLESVITQFLGASFKKRKGADGKVRTVPWGPTPTAVGAISTLIKHKTIVHSKIGTNTWFDCASGACADHSGRWLSFRNGLHNLDTGEVLDHDSAFFNTWSMRFDYNRDATCPLWEATLEQWLPGDVDAQRCVEEVMAYLLLGGMEFDKAFMLVGAPRSGKSTIMRLVSHMIGPAFTTQSLADLADRFGLEDLLGRTVCHFSEAAATRDMSKVVSLVKSITGQDDGRTVKRKGKESQHSVNLTTRFVFSGNEELNLLDDSGVIIDRLIVVLFGQSFLGKENLLLTPQLFAESSGIFNRLCVAYDRLMARGHFVQPASANEVVARLRERSAPDRFWWDNTVEVSASAGDYIVFSELVSAYQASDLSDVKTTDRQARMKINSLMSTRALKSVEKEHVGDAGERVRQRRVYGIRWRDSEHS